MNRVLGRTPGNTSSVKPALDSKARRSGLIGYPRERGVGTDCAANTIAI